MVKRWLRRLVVLISILVLVPVLILVVGALLLPRDKVRDVIVEQVATATGADVSLGEASIRFWPSLGLSLDQGYVRGTGAALAEATGSANTLKDYSVELDRLDVSVAIGPLLRKQIQVQSIRLTGPELTVAWDKGQAVAQKYDLEVSNLAIGLDAAQAAGSGGGAVVAGQKRPVGEMIPQDLVCDFSGQVARLILQKVPYDQVKIIGDLDARVLTVESLTAQRSTGSLSAAMEIDWERDPWGKLDFSVEATDVPAVSLLEPWAPGLGQRLACNLAADVSGACDIRDGQSALATLDLTGRLDSGEGTLHAQDWLRDVEKYLGDRKDLQDIRFRALTHEFRVSDGRYLIDHLHIDGLDTDWTGNGSVGLTGDIDMGVKVKLPPGFTPNLGPLAIFAHALRDDAGRINLDLMLSGKAAKPKVNVDLTKLQATGENEAAETVKKGLGGLLDKLKNR